MYIIVSWDISAEGQKWAEINNQMLHCLESFLHTKPVNTFYIVGVASEQHRQQIFGCLSNIRQLNNVSVEFVVSPLYTERGWLGATEENPIWNHPS